MHFVIAGEISCPQYTHAIMVAQRLKEHLPNFTYLKISKHSNEWKKWLIQTCKEHGWYHVQSPLIWREISMKNGKKEFIGNINKFLDMCYDYYGIPRPALSAENLSRSEINWFRNRTESEYFDDIKHEASKRRKYRCRQICITGACSQVAEVILMELIRIRGQSRENGLEIRLFDDPTKEKRLKSSANDAKYCPGVSGFGYCRVVNNLKEALTNVDLVIVLDSFSRKPKESIIKWLKRNRNAMCALGKALNRYAPIHCRVLIGSPSSQPICYNATVLASFATKLHVRNIVVVTQDLGREVLKLLSTKINVPLRNLYCPPVWGFIGLNKYVDVTRTLYNYLYKIPGKRYNLTIPQGTEEIQLRTVECLIDEEDTNELHVKVANHKIESLPQLGRSPCLAKASAIVNLLELWGIEQKDGNGEILSLGVYSDGTFNIPPGIYWSQPVILKNGFWVPFPDFPVPRDYHFNCYYFFTSSLASLYRTRVKPRRYISPSIVALPKKKKFDFEGFVGDVRIPTIKTDNDCVNYLKHLAKVELNIDFDLLDYNFNEDEEDKEEPEVEVPEKVMREELYCECWRLELKELQKVVFDRSSTTEVEIDLSENVSSSEWSVINTDMERDVASGLGEYKYEVHQTDSETVQYQKSSTTTSSGSISTICSCGAKSNGSICHCLENKRPPKEEYTSTENFYKEQNAEIFEDDLKDAIYADEYLTKKHVSFASEVLEKGKLSQLPRKFYGKDDAICDEARRAEMRKRILRYERGSINSLEEEFGEMGEATEIYSEKEGKDAQPSDTRFQVSIDGAPYDIIGDQDGLNELEIRKKEADRTSDQSFRDIYTDAVPLPVQVVPPILEQTESESESYVSFQGENVLPSPFFDSSRSFMGEGSTKHISQSSLESDSKKKLSEQSISFGEKNLNSEETGDVEYGGEISIKGEEIEEKEVQKLESENEEPKDVASSKEPKWKRLGIPLCCLCRCIVPEGLPCCLCGGSTVVEVFKKESIEIFVQSEDTLDYRIEYLERKIRPETETTEESLEAEELESEIRQTKDLPPESFAPFSPKYPNVFKETVRPWALTKEYIQSLHPKLEKEMPQKCIELLNMAKEQLEERKSKRETDNSLENKKSQQSMFETCKPSEPIIKSDFSNVHLFLPDGIEDWRLTVQTKYREWFFDGPKIRDEAYYDIAVEEISDDEQEIDKHLNIYFED